jgi:glycosyltransferase involved in cell wall biosynthesis
MKILQVHNFYGSSNPSGENNTVILEANCLRDMGHTVETFYISSDKVINGGIIGTIFAGLGVPWSIRSFINFRKFVKKFQPDIIHVHNTFPLLSPSIYYASKKIPYVLTLHNYRLACPAAIPLRDGKVCTLCIDKKNAWYSILYGCYRQSRLATLPLIINIELAKLLNTWNKRLSALLVFSDFQKDILIKYGISKKLFFIKPNFYPEDVKPKNWSDRQDSFLFIGRLSKEKGIVTLLNAWKLLGKDAPRLHIVGNGPEKNWLINESQNLPITVHGFLGEPEKRKILMNSKCLLIPSKWFEGQPATLIEALAYGLVVGVSNIGPLPSFVDNGEAGFIFDVDDYYGLAEKIRDFKLQEKKYESLAIKARTLFEANFMKHHNMILLENIYFSLLKKQ